MTLGSWHIQGARRRSRPGQIAIAALLVPAWITIAVSPPAFAQSVPAGKYLCKFSGRLAYDLTILAGGRYTGSDLTSGSYSVSASIVTFRGGVLGGRRGRFRSGPPPSIAMLGSGGGESEICELSQ
jgi:hypothetical protein